MDERDKFFERFYETAEKAVWDGLALDQYDVIGCIKSGGGFVLLMKKKDGGPMPYCIQRFGSGRYFSDFYSMADFAAAMYSGNRRIGTREYNALMAAYREHKKTGKPLVIPEEYRREDKPGSALPESP